MSEGVKGFAWWLRGETPNIPVAQTGSGSFRAYFWKNTTGVNKMKSGSLHKATKRKMEVTKTYAKSISLSV